jgi:hypothetical protein
MDNSENSPDLVNLDELPEVEFDKPAIPCDWLPCDFDSADKGILINHIGNQHISLMKKKYLETIKELTTLHQQRSQRNSKIHGC